MTRIEWGAEFELGRADLDEEHVRLIGMLNLVDEAVAAGPGNGETLRAVLPPLLDYTQEHFAHEEQLMSDAGLDETDCLHVARHRREHRRMRAHIERLAGDAADGRHVEVELYELLTVWLAAHIQGTDRELAGLLGPEKSGARFWRRLRGRPGVRKDHGVPVRVDQDAALTRG